MRWPCWTAFLSILRGVLILFETCRILKFCWTEMVFSESLRPPGPSVPADP
jgi:hypothetical protein